jgi:Spy/CpxP family protein refolding chaperone
MLIRTFVLLVLLAVAAVSIGAQHQTIAEQSFAYVHDGFAIHSSEMPEEALQKAKAALNLTEVQVTAFKALLKMRAETTQQIMQEVEAAQQKLHEISNRNSYNATEIGTAFLAVQTAHQRMEAARVKFRTDFESLLSPDQRSLLARLNTAVDQIETLRELDVLGDRHGWQMEHFELGMPFHGVKRIELGNK